MENFKFQISNFKIGVLTLLALVVIPLSCQAFSLNEIFEEFENWISNRNNNSQIINEVNISTNTGGNVVNGNGETKEGEAKSQIYVKNIINGKEIEPIDIETEANEVNVKSEIEVEDEIAKVHRETQIDSETNVEDYEVELDESASDTGICQPNEECFEEDLENKEAIEENGNKFFDWWKNFVDNLRSIINNIFSIF